MWLFGFSLLVVVCTARCTEADVSVEAAFQGRCGHGSPCEQLCYELHDGMYECDCTEGFELNKNGYSCQELNSTSSDDAASTSVEEDVLYQRGASFSAKLDTSDLHISMKTYDDGDDDDDDDDSGGDGDGKDGTGHTGEPDMKPINLNSIDGQLTLRKANHNWKVAAANNKTATQRAKEAAAGKSAPNRPVHLELNGATLRIQTVAAASADDGQEANRGEIKALALTALEDEPAVVSGGGSATMAPLVSSSLLPAHTVGNVTDSPATVAPTEVAFTEAREPCTLDCGFEGVCSNGETGQQAARCLCPYGKAGLKCEEDSHVNTPRFNQHSWLAFPALRGAYKHVQLHIEFRPESFDGILLLTGERDDLTGDFMALLLHQGFVEFWFDCGSGTGRVRSEETIVLNQWNSITIYRHRWDAWLVLNQGNRVQGRSKGLFSRITFREPVYLGGFGNITGLDKKLPVSNGFTGCIRKFVANDHDYNFQPASPGDVTRGFDIQECVTDRCSRYPCQHGGKCLPSDDGAICLCPLGFGGDLCEMRLDLQVPSFNGSSYLRYAPLGDSCIIWFELKIIIKPLLEDGLLLYSGHHDYGDYISLCLNMGYVEFTFDLGSGPAMVRSEFPLSMGQWHTIKVSRTSRLAVLKIDQLPEVMTVSPNGFWHLSLPHSLYLGGVHNIHTLPMSLRDKGSFAGCVQKVDINDRTISIISEALGGSNVENCPHACVARPCGPLAKCVPNLDSYECQCNPQNKQCNKAEELPPEVIEAATAKRVVVRVEQQHVTRRYEMDEYEEEEDDDERTTTTVAPTTMGAKSSGESSEDEYYYYEYDDEDSGASEVGKDGVVVKESEKVVLKIERKKENPDVTTSAGIDYEDKDQGGGKSSSEDGQSYYTEEDVDSDHDDYDDEESNLVESEPKKNYQKNVEKLSSFNKKPRKISTANRVDASRSSGVSNDAEDDAGYNQDYDRNGDRIPYRPDLLVRKAKNEQPRNGRGKQRRPEPERDTDIDEILIEEMSRIMKNKNDDDAGGEEENAADAADVTVDDSSWSYGMGDEELRHAGASIGPASLDDTPEQNLVDEEEDDDDDDDDDESNKSNQEKNSPPTEESSLLQQQQQQKEKEKQVLEQEQHEDEVVRNAAAAKYKGKYFRRRYQGACFTGTESYFHYSDAETMRRVISYEIDLNLRFKTHSTNGLILWTGRHSALEGDDFLSLGVENGYLHLRYNLGSGEINIKYNSTKVSDGLWHRVRALRNSQEGTLKVDGGKPITRRSPGKLRQLNTDTGLYVGGLPAAPFYTRQRYTAGIVGCISELILAGELRLNFDSTILGTAHNVEPGAP